MNPDNFQSPDSPNQPMSVPPIDLNPAQEVPAPTPALDPTSIPAQQPQVFVSQPQIGDEIGSVSPETIAPVAPVVTPQVVSSSFVSEPPTVAAPSTISQTSSTYESNPFLNTITGLMKILRFNPGTSMLSQLVSLLPFVVMGIAFILSITSGAVAIYPIVGLIFGLVYVPLYSGMLYVIASESIEERKVTLRDALSKATRKFLPMLGLLIIYVTCSVIGLFLLIIPGLIIMARGSLGFLLIFEEDLGPIKAFKRSISMTKGHTVEMLGSLFAANYISGGYLLLPATSMAPFVGRYDDLKQLEQTGQQKPKTHWTNWLSIVVPILVVIATVIILVVFVFSASHAITKSLQSTGNSGFNSSFQNSQSNLSNINSNGSFSQ